MTHTGNSERCRKLVKLGTCGGLWTNLIAFIALVGNFWCVFRLWNKCDGVKLLQQIHDAQPTRGFMHSGVCGT